MAKRPFRHAEARCSSNAPHEDLLRLRSFYQNAVALKAAAQLFLCNVLLHVDGDGDDDDRAADDVLEVCVDAEEIQAVVDRLQDDRADHDAGDGADAAVEGNAADDAARDGVKLVVDAGCSTDGLDTGALEEGGDAVHQTGVQEHAP